MSTTDSLMPLDVDGAPPRPNRKRFAGERLGAWIFAASFSVGIWGLALKVLAPTHPTPTATTPHYAVLAPSGAADGHAVVVWGSDPEDAATPYPATDGLPIASSNEQTQHRD